MRNKFLLIKTALFGITCVLPPAQAFSNESERSVNGYFIEEIENRCNAGRQRFCQKLERINNQQKRDIYNWENNYKTPFLGSLDVVTPIYPPPYHHLHNKDFWLTPQQTWENQNNYKDTFFDSVDFNTQYHQPRQDIERQRDRKRNPQNLYPDSQRFYKKCIFLPTSNSENIYSQDFFCLPYLTMNNQ